MQRHGYVVASLDWHKARTQCVVDDDCFFGWASQGISFISVGSRQMGDFAKNAQAPLVEVADDMIASTVMVREDEYVHQAKHEVMTLIVSLVVFSQV